MNAQDELSTARELAQARERIETLETAIRVALVCLYIGQPENAIWYLRRELEELE